MRATVPAHSKPECTGAVRLQFDSLINNPHVCERALNTRNTLRQSITPTGISIPLDPRPSSKRRDRKIPRCPRPRGIAFRTTIETARTLSSRSIGISEGSLASPKLGIRVFFSSATLCPNVESRAPGIRDPYVEEIVTCRSNEHHDLAQGDRICHNKRRLSELYQSWTRAPTEKTLESKFFIFGLDSGPIQR